MSEISEAETAEQAPPFVPPTPEALEALLPRYEIRQLIAHGGMGAVYAAVQRDLDRPAAIKVLPPDAARDRESIDRFRTEAKAMARLTHPNIPAVYDFGVVEEFCVLVMELVEGPNIYSLIRQGELKPAQALEVLAQVCDAVQFAHSRGVIHGDIKPGNILLNNEGQAKLADFGLARLMVHGDRDAESWTPMGTPEYAAPELYDRNAVPDHRADIYSLGVVLHEMLTGAPPVGEFDLPGEELGLDPRVDEIIAHCMELSPDKRYQSAQEVREVLRDILERRNVPVPPAAKAAKKKVVRATRRTPLGAKRRMPVSTKIAPSTQQRLAAAPLTASRAVVAKSAPKKRRVVVVEGVPSSRGLSEAAKRNLLIGAAVVVIVVAAVLMLTGGGKKPPPEEEKKEVKKAARNESVPDKPVEIIPTAPGTVTSPPPPSTPPPAPPPDPKPAVKVQSPAAALAKIQELRSSYRNEWNTRVEEKISDALTRLSGQYSQALQKLDDEYVAKPDPTAVLAVRAEAERFEKFRDGVKPEAMSANPAIAKLQTSLNAQLEKLRAGFKYDMDSVKEKYMLALKDLERKMDEREDKAGSKAAADEFQRVAGLGGESLKSYFNAEGNP